MDFKEAFALNVNSKTEDEFVILKNNVRISVITNRLIRVEHNNKKLFVDEPTQKVWYRAFSSPKFSQAEKGNSIIINTSEVEFCCDTISGKVKYIKVGKNKITNFKKGNLGGTYRTLDMTRGPVKLGDGVVSKNGATVFDDSKSLILKPDGAIEPRKNAEQDKYYFAYGRNYRECIKAFFELTGYTPLVPRFCLGNWWSRYKAYSQQEYVDLMTRFLDEEIPITVATIDMDWHWVDVVSKFGEKAKRKVANAKNFREVICEHGWTGYSWNTDLFPDYKGFLKWLKEKNFNITVNLHPADGVRSFEDMYEDVAKYMGQNPKDGYRINFEIWNTKYVEAYFEYLHHPYEKDGVDFWWIDWQQGKNSGVKGLDPLWALNHYHYLDNCRNNKRGLILSRYAEAGSQRYPLGFSGDTSIKWSCYKFQPYFTSTATNIGYTWWSHDIGGHHMGEKDDELYLRWLQFGVFSPINRLHSTSNEFAGKEIWKMRYDVNVLSKDFLRLRHRLIPYIYTMNYHTHKDGIALIEPMYYRNPNEEKAYSVPNEYYFGSELIAAPITEKLNAKTNLAASNVYLPKGRYTDIFTKRIYEGEKTYNMYRGIESFPLLAKDGSIIPLDVNSRNNNSENPKALEILIFRGNGAFKLYEDDGISMDFEKGKCAFTEFTVSQSDNNIKFVINPATGDNTVIPKTRDYTLTFFDITACDKILVNGEDFKPESGKCTTVLLKDIKPTDKVEISLLNVTALENRDKRESLIELVSKFQCGVNYKKSTFTNFVNSKNFKNIPNVPKYFKEPIIEILSLK
ncbi:MAG: glycoside hydrolase family 31 protein [Oscillospiraceae bacterium]